eukprot:1195526-Prorocentrum_minimum.AAC.4
MDSLMCSYLWRSAGSAMTTACGVGDYDGLVGVRAPFLEGGNLARNPPAREGHHCLQHLTHLHRPCAHMPPDSDLLAKTVAVLSISPASWSACRGRD